MEGRNERNKRVRKEAKEKKILFVRCVLTNHAIDQVNWCTSNNNNLLELRTVALYSFNVIITIIRKL